MKSHVEGEGINIKGIEVNWEVVIVRKIYCNWR